MVQKNMDGKNFVTKNSDGQPGGRGGGLLSRMWILDQDWLGLCSSLLI